MRGQLISENRSIPYFSMLVYFVFAEFMVEGVKWGAGVFTEKGHHILHTLLHSWALSVRSHFRSEVHCVYVQFSEAHLTAALFHSTVAQPGDDRGQRWCTNLGTVSRHNPADLKSQQSRPQSSMGCLVLECCDQTTNRWNLMDFYCCCFVAK